MCGCYVKIDFNDASRDSDVCLIYFIYRYRYT